MKIFFGDANPSNYPGINTSGLFLNPENRQYYFYLIETDEDGSIRLRDTCNRMVPFDISQIEALSDAVYVLREMEETRSTLAQDLEDGIQDIIKTTHEYTGVRVLG